MAKKQTYDHAQHKEGNQVARKHRAVLVLPDVGLPEEKIQELTEEFQNHIVGTLRKAGANFSTDALWVVVVVVIAVVGTLPEPGLSQ